MKHSGNQQAGVRGALMAAAVALGAWAALAGSARADEFLVGSELPLSGTLARAGAGMGEGVAVAVEVFNKTNGRHKVKIITIDDESTPAKAVAAVEKLANDNVLAITGGYGSNNISPATDAANKLGLVYVTGGGVDDSLVTKGYKTFFRITNTPGYHKALMGLLADLKVKSVSLLYSTKEASQALANDMKADLKNKGVEVALHPFDPAITDFKPIVNKVKLQDKSEVMVMICYENDYVGIIRAAKVLKPPVKALIGAWSLATPKMAAEFPDLMPNVYGTSLLPSPVDFKTEEGKAFAAAYKKLYNKDPDYLGLYGYTQSMLLFEAIARAAAAKGGPVKRADVAEEMRKTDKETLIGRVQFNDKGDNFHFAHRVGQHQPGKIVIVWPKAEATGTINYPGLPW